MQVVNGYMCRDCTDVALAKKGIDPVHPQRPLAVRSPETDARAEPGTSAALATSGDVGTRLHLVA